MIASADLRERAGRIRLLTFDVDGVLTDGRIYIDDEGRESKAFSVLDGLGMKLAMQAGIGVAWITGSQAPAVAHRARQLGIRHLAQGAEHKLAAWERLRAEFGVPPEGCAHVGDDLPDVAVFRRCGLAVTVPGAPAPVAACAHWVTQAPGGMGAAREVCDLLVAAQGRLAELLAAYEATAGGGAG
jgi:3-deoxy-D-manno-octulosonate 8-phosphate phosphatase (KDO 8-P phosphatase)